MSPNMDHHVVLIKEDFNVLNKVIARQVEIIQQLLSGIVEPDDYEHIEMNETIIDSLEVKIRSEVINGIVLYTPRASEARRMFALHDMTSYLERIGDLLLNVANFTRTIDSSNGLYLQYAGTLHEMLSETYQMVTDAVTSFFAGDSDLSRRVIRRDTHVDDLHYQINDSLPQALLDAEQTPDIDSIQASLAISSIAYNLERIGDNATNIAEAAIFHSEGKNLLHAKNQKVEIPTEPELDNYGQEEV